MDNTISNQIRTVFSKISEGFAYCKILTDEMGKPVDWVYLDVNDAYEKINGVKKETVVGKKASEVLPNLHSDPADWVAAYGHVALTGEPLVAERYAQVRQKWYHISAYSPQKGYFVSIFEDITDRKKTEESLKKLNDELEERILQRTKEVEKARERLYNVLETLPSYVVLLDENYEVPFANKVFRETFGESKGRRCYEFLFNRSSECENCETYKVLKTKKPHRWEWTGPNGRNYDIYDFPFYEADGKMSILEMGVDITDRKIAEAAVQTERKRLFDVLETLPAMICLLTPDRHVAFANRSFREKFGESSGRFCYDYCFGRSKPCEFCESYKVLETGKPHHWEVNAPDGSVIDAYDFPFVDADGSPMILEMDLDITQRRHIEAELKKYQEHLEQLVTERTKQLRESELRWATTLSSIGDAVIATDTEGKVTFMNAVSEQLTGWTLQEAKGKPISAVFNIVNEKTRRKVENPVTKVLQMGCVVGLANHTILIRKDKTEVPVDDSGAPIRTEDGKTSGVVLVFRDITQRKKNEESIRQSEERFEKAFHNNPAAMTISRLSDGKWVDVNEAFLQLTGFTRAEIVGHNSTELRMFDGDPCPTSTDLAKLDKTGNFNQHRIGRSDKKRQTARAAVQRSHSQHQRPAICHRKPNRHNRTQKIRGEPSETKPHLTSNKQ